KLQFSGQKHVLELYLKGMMFAYQLTLNHHLKLYP
ncbi:hypothetical protein Csa_023908, partial [Cucumis sativus]